MIDLTGQIDLPIQEPSIIKVIGVGGGGGNAVNFMYRQGIRDVSFLVCNTDEMALVKMDVPAKLRLGEGLGAGGRPERAKELAEQSEQSIRESLSDGTRMVFVTAGMGGGTGTGASPVVAQVAQDMGILTVGIVTIPFLFEGKRVIRKAMRGIASLAQHTDALLVINNEKLKQLYPDLDTPNAFNKADEVLCNAARSIAEIITIPGYINTDFQDVYNTLKDGNMAIMNVGRASGEDRITRAIRNALESPLVNTNDIYGANRILLNFYCSKEHAILMKELDQVDAFCDSVGEDVEVRWGITYDDDLADEVKVTIIATGYQVSDIPGLEDAVSDEYQPKEPLPEQPKITQEEAQKKLYEGLDHKNNNEDKTEDNPVDNDEDKNEVIEEEGPTIIDFTNDFGKPQAPVNPTPSVNPISNNQHPSKEDIDIEEDDDNNSGIWNIWKKRRH